VIMRCRRVTLVLTCAGTVPPACVAGKAWARKAPIRLCDAAFYGTMNEPDEQVPFERFVLLLWSTRTLIICWAPSLTGGGAEPDSH